MVLDSAAFISSIELPARGWSDASRAGLVTAGDLDLVNHVAGWSDTPASTRHRRTGAIDLPNKEPTYVLTGPGLRFDKTGDHHPEPPRSARLTRATDAGCRGPIPCGRPGRGRRTSFDRAPQ